MGASSLLVFVWYFKRNRQLTMVLVLWRKQKYNILFSDWLLFIFLPSDTHKKILMSLVWAGLVFISMGGPIIFGVLTLFEEEISQSEHNKLLT